MEPLTLSRIQFAVTTVYHFFFVPLTMGLAILIALMETLYVRSGDEQYKRMAQFWGKLFLINFAMGVVTGLVQEFQFGLNWSNFSRFVGDVFGAVLAIETLLAFFLESTFLGVWFFGWEKLSKRAHLATIWAVVIGSQLSGLIILVANSFMQQPMAYVIRNGRAEMTDFLALATNPHVFYQYSHVFFSGLTTAAFFVLGISAYHLRKNWDNDFFQRSFRIGLLCALISSPMSGITGHSQGVHKLFTQPMKMAAAEALWETENPASFSVVSIIDEKNQRDVFAIRLPGVLSWLYFFRFEGEVPGIKNLQEEFVKQYGAGNYVPPVVLTYWSFRLMVAAGLAMVGLAGLGVLLLILKRLARAAWFLGLLVPAILLPYLANTTGWLMTEMGRQPWVVYGVMKTEQAVSPTLTTEAVLFSLITFTLLYGVLMIVDVYLLAKFARQGPKA
ncbi:MAG: cytochrome ubiquinol oxidase subunit I [Anaerolineae bacterium]|nr:cytochrome ubiquinol oxidase subunit I [Anaerolineae bacterium]